MGFLKPKYYVAAAALFIFLVNFLKSDGTMENIAVIPDIVSRQATPTDLGIQRETSQNQPASVEYLGIQRETSQNEPSSVENLGLQRETTQSEPASVEVDIYHPDMMRHPKIKFDPNFKNPCWKEKGHFRCLPYWFMFGVKKCGTSTLSKRMFKHPEIVYPGFTEAQFFARKRFKIYNNTGGIYPYADMFEKASTIIQSSASKDKNGILQNQFHVTGEKSPSNLHLNTYWKELPGNENLQEPKYVNLDYIHHFLPDAKVLILFRNPLLRLFSDYFHEFGTLMPKNKPNPWDFHEKVVNGLQLYEECFANRTIRSCVYDPEIPKKTKFQIQLGIYYIYMEDLLRLYPREQILVLKNEELRNDMKGTLKRVFKFLNVRELSKKEMKPLLKDDKISPNPYSKMLDETADLLYAFYQPFNKKMAELTGDDDFLYIRLPKIKDNAVQIQ